MLRSCCCNELQLLFLILIALSCNCIPDGDLCKWMNGRKYYIEMGETGIISAENMTTPPANVKGDSSSERTTDEGQPPVTQRCSVELITCPSCHLEITLLRLNIPTCSTDGTCRCDFLWIKEAAFSKSGQEYCGFKRNDSKDLVFESKTKLVSIDFLYSGIYQDAFTLQFSAKKNVYVYKGGYDYHQPNNTGTISSPNFPGGYPSDYSSEYILENIDTNGYVQLLFTDFQLSLWSYMEILDSNGSRIDVYNGNTFRPPAIISSGPTLTVKFQANDEYPSSGFKAQFNFVSYPEKYWINRPSTDCGGFVEDYGGAITMMNMVPGDSLRAFDCIWLIRPRNAHVPTTQISIRVAQFEEMGMKSTLTIRKGLYSEAPLLESVTSFQHHKMPRGQEYVVPAINGFYIRLIGYFNNKSHLAIIYTTFRYEGCYAAADFECKNGRCIKGTLRCDGFNHCGDGSDEASCYGTNRGTPLPEDANWWRTLTPNYYFPKPDNNSNAGTNTLILVTSLAGLGMFILTTVVVLVKLHKQRHDDSISREILHTVSADIDSENSPNHSGASDPPVYDPPPSYEDVIKFYLPPPPAYNSLGQNQTENRGTDNTAYRSDSPTVIRGRHRRAKATKLQRTPIQESSHPVILRVSLPSEESIDPVHITTVAKDSSNANSVSTVQNTVLSSADNAERQDTNARYINQNSPRRAVTLNYTSENDNKNFSAINCHLNSSQQSSEILTCKDNATHISCECQGACTCASQESKRIVAYNFGNQEEISSIKNNKQNDVLKKNTSADNLGIFNKSVTLENDITPNPPSINEAVKSSKSSKSIDLYSKSEGPSSPTMACSNQSTFNSSCTVKKSNSTSRLFHRRSSSGPSNIWVENTFDQTKANSEKINSSESKRNDALNQNQAMYLASVLLNDFQQSFASKNISNIAQENNQEEEQNVVDRNGKTVSPVTWSNIWNPVKKKPEKSELVKSTVESRSWHQSDTQPLLRKAVSQNTINSIVICPQSNRSEEQSIKTTIIKANNA